MNLHLSCLRWGVRMTDDPTLDDVQPGKYADVMPNMDDEEFASLKRSIETNGFDETTPIVVDADGDIVDGHHRYKACVDLGVEPAIVRIGEATVEQAFRSNVARRNLDDGDLREAVAAYLKEYYDGDRSQRTLAGDLGVSQATINRAIDRLDPEPSGDSAESLNSVTDGKSEPSGDTSDSTETKDREEQVRDYYDEHPDASSREIAEAVDADVSHVTVTNWIEEWEEQGDGAPPDSADGGEDRDDAADASVTPDAEEHTFEADYSGTEGGGASATTPSPGGDRETGVEPGTSAALSHVDDLERQLEDVRDERDRLRRQVDRKDARIDELEALVRDFERAVENQDAEAIQETADRAGELLG